MPLTPYQERLKRLWEGDPSANRALPETTEAAAPAYSPQDYQTPDTRPSTPQIGYSNNKAYSANANQAYMDAIGNRFSQITGMGAAATNRSLAAAQQQAAAAYAAQQQAANAASAVPVDQGTGSVYSGPAGGARKTVLAAAAAQIGKPYSWGGGNSKGASYGLSGSGERHGSSKIYGFDCSGLVQYAYAQVGIKLPRGGNAQLATGTRMPINKLSPGDMVGKPGHIAIYAGNGMMYEAPTFGKRVRLVPVRKGMFGVHVNY